MNKIERMLMAFAVLLPFLTACGRQPEFIEVTEWVNGEGWDITINDRHFSLHIDELEAINYLTRALQFEKE